MAKPELPGTMTSPGASSVAQCLGEMISMLRVIGHIAMLRKARAGSAPFPITGTCLTHGCQAACP